jgi:hypothetical protein
MIVIVSKTQPFMPSDLGRETEKCLSQGWQRIMCPSENTEKKGKAGAALGDALPSGQITSDFGHEKHYRIHITGKKKTC